MASAAAAFEGLEMTTMRNDGHGATAHNYPPPLFIFTIQPNCRDPAGGETTATDVALRPFLEGAIPDMPSGCCPALRLLPVLSEVLLYLDGFSLRFLLNLRLVCRTFHVMVDHLPCWPYLLPHRKRVFLRTLQDFRANLPSPSSNEGWARSDCTTPVAVTIMNQGGPADCTLAPPPDEAEASAAPVVPTGLPSAEDGAASTASEDEEDDEDRGVAATAGGASLGASRGTGDATAPLPSRHRRRRRSRKRRPMYADEACNQATCEHLFQDPSDCVDYHTLVLDRTVKMTEDQRTSKRLTWVIVGSIALFLFLPSFLSATLVPVVNSLSDDECNLFFGLIPIVCWIGLLHTVMKTCVGSKAKCSILSLLTLGCVALACFLFALPSSLVAARLGSSDNVLRRSQVDVCDAVRPVYDLLQGVSSENNATSEADMALFASLEAVSFDDPSCCTSVANSGGASLEPRVQCVTQPPLSNTTPVAAPPLSVSSALGNVSTTTRRPAAAAGGLSPPLCTPRIVEPGTLWGCDPQCVENVTRSPQRKLANIAVLRNTSRTLKMSASHPSTPPVATDLGYVLFPAGTQVDLLCTNSTPASSVPPSATSPQCNQIPSAPRCPAPTRLYAFHIPIDTVACPKWKSSAVYGVPWWPNTSSSRISNTSTTMITLIAAVHSPIGIQPSSAIVPAPFWGHDAFRGAFVTVSNATSSPLVGGLPNVAQSHYVGVAASGSSASSIALRNCSDTSMEGRAYAVLTRPLSLPTLFADSRYASVPESTLRQYNFSSVSTGVLHLVADPRGQLGPIRIAYRDDVASMRSTWLGALIALACAWVLLTGIPIIVLLYRRSAVAVRQVVKFWAGFAAIFLNGIIILIVSVLCYIYSASDPADAMASGQPLYVMQTKAGSVQLIVASCFIILAEFVLVVTSVCTCCGDDD